MRRVACSDRVSNETEKRRVRGNRMFERSSKILSSRYRRYYFTFLLTLLLATLIILFVFFFLHLCILL